MKREDLREFSAIPMVLFVLAILALIMLAFTQGLWAWLGPGLVFVVALAAVALVDQLARAGRRRRGARPLPDSRERARGHAIPSARLEVAPRLTFTRVSRAGPR